MGQNGTRWDEVFGGGEWRGGNDGVGTRGRAGAEVGNDTLCRRSGPLRNRPQNGVQGADLLKELPVKDKGGQRGPSEG